MIKRALERAGERLLRLAEMLICEKSDKGDARLRKTLLMAAVLTEWPAALIWGLIYLAFDEPVAALVPFLYVVMVSANIAFFRARRHFVPFRLFHLSTTLPTALPVDAGSGRVYGLQRGGPLGSRRTDGGADLHIPQRGRDMGGRLRAFDRVGRTA